MRVVLRTDLDQVGKRGDIVDVSDGYARNFLLPKGHAIKATSGVTAQAGSMRRARDLKDARDREAAELVARTLVPMVIRIPARAGSGERAKLFGSITTADVVEAVAEQARCDPRPPAAAPRRADQDARHPRDPRQASFRCGVPGDRRRGTAVGTPLPAGGRLLA